MHERRRLWRIAGSLVALAVVSGCAAGVDSAPPPAVATTPAVTAPPAPPSDPSRTVNWFDLDAGDCLADPPPTDPTVIGVRVVDCATPHQAEVFRRAPMALNNALAEVADRECGSGFLDYTGRSIDGSPFTTTYLIDSNQNRTAANPNPSTVICLLQPADGAPLMRSARR